MIHRSILPCVLLLMAVLPRARADDQADTLEQLRHNYQQARAAAAKIDQPKKGSPDFQEKLKVWSAVTRKQREAAELLVPALLKHWATLSDDSDELMAIAEEIRTAYTDMSGKPLTARNSKAKSYFAGEVLPLLVDFELTRQRAALLVELTTPFAGIRINDKIALLDRPTEPLGWIVQDAHSLALLRAGRIDDARRESELLIKKVTINVQRGRVPNGKVNYRGGKRTQKSLRREYLLHGALIEASGGNIEGATKMLSDAQAIKEVQDTKDGQKRLVGEIITLIDFDA